jgi:23S rRNA maturation mini-RNase III
MIDITKIYIKSKYSIAGMFFDVVMTAQHDLQTEITKHPVQYGAMISDHAITQPDRLTSEIGVSDSKIIEPAALAGVGDSLYDIHINDVGTYLTQIDINKIRDLMTSNLSRSGNAFSNLNILRIKRWPFDVTTRLKTYKNMLITNISAPETNETYNALTATVTMEEVLIVTAQKVQTKSTYHAIEQTSSGQKQTQDVKINNVGKSILKIEKG